ncbi:hypothetical protein GALL_460670 [mine drainage metagenome]|uniref:NAD-specific glutamate dehydrogenase n=1 Tax=mine drainage metagenome TaxID=410659 RepID=A0A1J5PXL5_9ZZZZ
MLARDAQGRAVFHQPDVVNVGHLGAADPLIDPAHDIAENALAVVVDLLPHIVGRPVRLRYRNGEDVRKLCARAGLRQLLLARQHVDLVIMQRMQRRRGRRRHPCGGGAGLRVGDLLRQHVRHHVRRGPHALADLGVAGQAVDQADIDVRVLIALDPGLGLHVVLANHGACFHRGMDLVAGTVEEAGIDEHDALEGLLDAGLEVHGGAAILVHDADLHGVFRQRQHLFDPGEQFAGKPDLVGAVHLRLDDIDRAGAAVAHLRVALEIVDREQAGDGGVEQAFRNFLAGSVEHRIGEHVMADIAHQQKAAAVQLEFTSVRGLVDAVGIERARQRLAALLEVGRQRAVHQPERVAIDQHLVLGVDGRDAVFHVEDRADGGFQDHVSDARRIVLADHVAAVDLDFDMQAVVDQKDGRGRGGVAAIARELGVRFQRGGVAALQFDRELATDDAVGSHIGVAAGRQRHGGIEEGLGFRDYLVAARLVEALGPLACFVRDRVGAVQRVVKTAPARVGGVQGITRIGEGHDQLGSADFSDLFIDIGRFDLLGRRFRQQISDLLQKRRVGIEVDRLALVGAVPVVDLRLQGVAEGEQFAIFRRQIADDGGQPCPERVGRNPGFRGRFPSDEIKQNGGDLQSVGIDTIHDGFFSRETALRRGFQG